MSTPTELTTLGRFRAADVERAYRTASRASDTRKAIIVFAAAMVTNIPMAMNDAILSPERAGRLLVWRAAFVTLGVVTCLSLRRTTDPARWDRLVFVVTTFIAAASVAISVTRPPTFSGWVAPNAVLTIAMVTFIRLPVFAQVVPALVVAGGHLALAFSRPIGAPERMAALVSFVAAVGLGLEMSRRAHLRHREDFALRAELEEALAEIKTLRGLVSICAHCKSIKNDHGEWQRLEVALHNRTHAELTHGICPTCFEREYADA